MIDFKHLLVTGGAGFIGSNFCRYIMQKYPVLQVTILDALTYAGNPKNFEDLQGEDRFAFVHGDIRDKDIVDGLVAKADVIVNFAAETHIDRSLYFAGDFVETDVLGTFVLLEAARKHSIKRFLHISTDEVYGSIVEGTFTENDRLNPSSPYSSSKGSADLLVRSYFITYNLPVLITRSSNNFGPYQYPKKIIAVFITNAIDDIPLLLYADGMNVTNWLFVTDNCCAIDTVLHKGNPGEIYNIGGDNERTNIEITRKILDILGKDDSLIKYVIDRPGHDLRYSISSEKVKKLGWNVETTFNSALEQTVKWYVDNEDWWRPLKDKKFQEFYKMNYKKR